MQETLRIWSLRCYSCCGTTVRRCGGSGGGRGAVRRKEDTARRKRRLLQQDRVAGQLEDVDWDARVLRGEDEVHQRDVLARQVARRAEDQDPRRQGDIVAGLRGGRCVGLCGGDCGLRGRRRHGEGRLVDVGERQGQRARDQGRGCRRDFGGRGGVEEGAEVCEDFVFDEAEGAVFVRVVGDVAVGG